MKQYPLLCHCCATSSHDPASQPTLVPHRGRSFIVLGNNYKHLQRFFLIKLQEPFSLTNAVVAAPAADCNLPWMTPAPQGYLIFHSSPGPAEFHLQTLSFRVQNRSYFHTSLTARHLTAVVLEDIHFIFPLFHSFFESPQSLCSQHQC